DAARARLEDTYPSREIRVLDTRTLVAVGGSIHCITQQRPKDVSKAT
ncbi:MAG: agmatine deiminase family protein, partial [Pseudomonadota bacterium]|nr:agmatine deiminase family protein [Pseudomonadota bacterium]